MQDVISQSHANSVNYSQPTHFAITRFATNFHFTAVLREFAIDLFVKMTDFAKNSILQQAFAMPKNCEMDRCTVFNKFN